MDEEVGGPEASPLEAAPLLSRALFSWLDPLLDLGSCRQLRPEDLPSTSPQDGAAAVQAAFQAAWTALPVGSSNRLAYALLAVCRPALVKGAAFKLVYDTLLFCGPIALRGLLQGFESGAPDPVVGAGYAVTMFVASMAQTVRMFIFGASVLFPLSFQSHVLHQVCISQYFHYGFETGMQARTAVIGSTFRKTMQLSLAARGAVHSGEVMNFASSDAKRLADAAPYAAMIWSGPYQVIISIALLWSTLGPAFWAGIGVILAVIPLSGVLSFVQVYCSRP